MSAKSAKRSGSLAGLGTEVLFRLDLFILFWVFGAPTV